MSNEVGLSARLPKVGLSALLLTLLIAASPPVGLAQNGPEFRVESREVLVPVNAVDGSGKDISNLTANDFHLFQDGREQKIRVAMFRADIRRFDDHGASFSDVYSYYSTMAKWTTESSLHIRDDHLYVLAYTGAGPSFRITSSAVAPSFPRFVREGGIGRVPEIHPFALAAAPSPDIRS